MRMIRLWRGRGWIVLYIFFPVRFLLGSLFTDAILLKGTIRLRDIAVVHLLHLPDRNGIAPLCSSPDAAPASLAARMAFSSFCSLKLLK